MKKLRVLVLMHDYLVPPADVTGIDRETGRQFAAQVDGRSVVIIGVTKVDGGWAVGRDSACSG